MMKQLTKKKVQMSESAVVNLVLALSGAEKKREANRTPVHKGQAGKKKKKR